MLGWCRPRRWAGFGRAGWRWPDSMCCRRGSAIAGHCGRSGWTGWAGYWTNRAGLFDVGKGAAEVGGVGDGLAGEGGDLLAGEEGDLQGFPRGKGDHPVGVVAATEAVFAQEFLRGGDVEAVEAAGAGGVAVGVEGGGDFGLFEAADEGDGEADVVDGELVGREGDVAGDGLGGVAGGLPCAFFLRGCGEGEE